VLTGGGALLPGAVELAAHVFKLPVRIGEPLSEGLGGLVKEYRSPIYAPAVGLVLEGRDREDHNKSDRGAEPRPREKGPSPFGKLKDWLTKEFF
jgi:cell division protein FtsA